MAKTRILIGFFSIFLVSVFTSCVSKQKYTDMVYSRDRANDRVRELTNTVDSLHTNIKSRGSDYNAMKNELMYSNAQKDAKMDSFMDQVQKVESEASVSSGKLEDKLFALQSEKRQLKDAITSRDESIKELTSQLNALKGKYDTAKKDLIDAKFELNNEKDKLAANGNKMKSSQTKINSLSSQVKKLQSEVSTLKTQVADKNTQIKRLENNVKLLKNQL